jgi:hypothetical protein
MANYVEGLERIESAGFYQPPTENMVSNVF